jgi:hypothetical protein
MSRAFWCGAVLSIAPMVAGAQGSVGVNPVYRRAQTMVNDGNAAAGRALVDSMIAVAAPGSNDYAEGVYWRAVLAATAADAEMDYRRLLVDHPLSPRIEDALIRLAQLEIARANYDSALKHLNKLAAEHPESPARARAGYWTARALFDKNDIQGGCTATADALARTSEDDAELRTQISYLNQRCAGVVLTPPATAAVSGTPTTGAPITGAPPTGAPTSSVATPVTTQAAAPTRDTTTPTAKVITPPPAPPQTRVDSPKTTATATPAPKKSPLQPPAKPRDVEPSMVEPPLTIPPPVPTSSEGSKAYSVQVAAYNLKSQADAMVSKLKKSGYEARVDGKAAPFRVRIGRYATQAQASAVQRSLKAKKIAGFVVQADTQ